MIYFIWGSGGLLPGHSVWTLWLKNIQYCLDHHHKVWGWTKEAFRSVSLERCSTNTSIYEKYYHGGCLELFAVWRGCGFNHYWCFKVTMVLFTLSHSHLMDLNSSPGLITRLFEFGMWAQASRCLHHCGATMVTFIPHMSTGVKMLPPLQGHNDHIYSITFFQMDPKLSLGLVTSNLGCDHRHGGAATTARPQLLQVFCCILAQWIQNCLWVSGQDHLNLVCEHKCPDAATAARPWWLHLFHCILTWWIQNCHCILG